MGVTSMMAGQLAEIQAKLDVLRPLAAEPGSKVVIADGVPLASVPGLPAGVSEVFSLFSEVRGNNFRFLPPSEISSPAAWAARVVNPHCPLGNPIDIGYEIRDVPADVLDEVGGRAAISLDVASGEVFYLDPDDYVWAYKNLDEEFDVQVFADDVVTFVNDHVLGADYRDLADTMLGGLVVDRRDRTGSHADTWLRLLVRAGLAPAEPG